MFKDKKRGNFPVAAQNRAMVRQKDAKDESSPRFALIKAILWGMGAATASGLILVTLATVLAYALPDPSAYVSPLALVALMPSMFIGGFVAEKKVGSSPLLCGILTGGSLTLFSMLLCLVMRALPSSHYQLWQSAALHFAAVAFSVLGAFAGSVKRKPKRGKRRFGR